MLGDTIVFVGDNWTTSYFVIENSLGVAGKLFCAKP